MPNDPLLQYALLSMDVYHTRAPGGLADLVPSNTTLNDAVRLAPISDAAIGFVAQTYTLDGQTVIVYRGTDDYLASDESAFTTGQTFLVDGGFAL